MTPQPLDDLRRAFVDALARWYTGDPTVVIQEAARALLAGIEKGKRNGTDENEALKQEFALSEIAGSGPLTRESHAVA